MFDKNNYTCSFCQSKGKILYKDLKDTLYGVPGSWNIVKCENEACGILTLYPIPTEDYIENTYDEYHTHLQYVDNVNRRKFSDWLDKLKNDYFRFRYGNNKKKFRFKFLIIRFIYFLYPTKRTWIKSYDSYLKKNFTGKFLDFGCGSGNNLLMFKNLGWDVEGIDIDDKALAFARKRNLKVTKYNNKKLPYLDKTFDLILLDNVFEHILNPKRVFIQIYNILRDNGHLVIITPNMLSLSHKIFKRNWRGLEPPRHLQIMNMKALVSFLTDLGFKKKYSVCSFSNYYYEKSYLLYKNKDRLSLIENLLLKSIVLFFSTILFYRKSSGDQIFLVMTK